MATRTVEIKISAEGGNYIAEVNKIIEKNNQLNRAAVQGAQQTTAAVERTAQAYIRFDNSTKGLGVSLKNVGSATGVVIGQLGAIGPVANLASNALVAMTTASGPAGLALGGLAAAVGFLVYRIDQAKERLAALAELQLAAIAREQKGLVTEQETKRRIAVLQAEIPEIEEVRQKYTALRLELEKGEARPQAIAAVDKAQALEIAAIQKKRAEDLKKDTDQARESLMKQIEAVREQTIALNEGEAALTLYKIANLRTSEAVEKLGVDGRNLLEVLKNETLALNEQKAALQQITDLNKFLAESEKAEADSKVQAREELEKEFELKEKLNALEVERIRALGLTDQAEKLELQNKIKLNEERAKALDLAAQEGSIARAPGEIAELNKQADVAKTKLAALGQQGIDVAGEVARVVTDITGAVINGTLRWADIGRSVLASFVRIALEQFTGFLRNMQAVANAANIAGAAGQVAGGATTGAGGGGGAGGFGGGMVGTIFSGLSTAYSAFSSTTLGASIAASVAQIASTVSTTITSTLTTVTGWLATIPVVGWIAAAVVAVVSGIYRIIANQQERPNAKFTGSFAGVAFDPELAQFVPGDIGVQIGRKVGIKNSQAGAIADNLQKRLLILSNQWTDILNIFPDFLSEEIVPALDITNARLNYNFKNLKLSPGGSRNIQQELEDLSGPGGQVRFLDAFIAPLAAGFSASLAAALVPRNVNQLSYGGPGFGSLQFTNQWRATKEEIQDTVKALTDVAELTSQLASVGAGKFLTGADLDAIGSLFDQLFSISDTTTFTKAAAELKEKLKPALDFLQQSVQESTELFGRGLMAALNAASESDAVAAFAESLGQGVKDSIFQGIVQSFVASSQFGDLLAPIQQQIREFTQQALTTGTQPDIAAFRRAILPTIEAIAGRMDILKPLIAELQKLGLDISDTVANLFGPEKIKPVDEFLQQSIKTATDLFQRGLIAALDAATSSQANEAFLANLGQGVKDILFKGITDAFIASAQFDTLLQPIQDTIQTFIKEAVAGGKTPDLAAFRAAILPQIGDLSSRAQTLAPLIAELQKLGFDFKDALKVFASEARGAPNVTINIENFTNEDDPASLARKIQDLLGGRLAPAA